MKTSSRKHWLWVGAAAGIGWLASAIFAGLLHWSRARFVLGYGVLAGAFLILYFRFARIDLRTQLRRRWVAGTFGGLIFGSLLIWTVSIQPGSVRPDGPALLGALAWYGVVYGALDASLLSVVPVLGIYGSRPQEELQQARPRLGWALAALAGSLLITALYHLGFPEFRGPALIKPLIGSLIITTGYLVTGNPLAAIIAHVIMHSAAVVHGMDTTAQLPPHY